jgi:ATP-dependent DNA helicase RecG
MIFGKESETVEFKKTTGELSDSLKDIAAILNKHNRGELYFGIRNDGAVLGQMISDSTLRDISQRISDKIRPQIYPIIDNIKIHNKDCIRVIFEGEDAPYFANGRAYIRVADESKQLSPTELEKFFKSKRQASPWDSSPSDGTFNDINTNKLRSYMKRANETGRLNYRFSSKNETLKKLGLVKRGQPTNPAVALFGKNPGAEIQMATFATAEKRTFNDIKRSKGTVFEMVDAGEMYIRNVIRWRVVFDGSIERNEIPEIPIGALREALLNSYTHRDNLIPQVNEIAIFSDRIEIYNPGTFPEGLSPEDYINGEENSVHRNPKLAELMYYTKDIESFGTGLKRIADECREADVAFEFQRRKSGFAVVFFRKPVYEDDREGSGDFDRYDATPQVAPQVTPQVTPQVAPEVARLIDAIEGEMTRAEIQERLNLSDRKNFIEKYLKAGLDSEVIEMTIPNKPKSRLQKYRLTEIGVRLKNT